MVGAFVIGDTVAFAVLVMATYVVMFLVHALATRGFEVCVMNNKMLYMTPATTGLDNDSVFFVLPKAVGKPSTLLEPTITLFFSLISSRTLMLMDASAGEASVTLTVYATENVSTDAPAKNPETSIMRIE